MEVSLQRRREVLAAVAEALRIRPSLYNWFSTNVDYGRRWRSRPCACVGGLATMVLTKDPEVSFSQSVWGSLLSEETHVSQSGVGSEDGARMSVWLRDNLERLAAL